MSGWLPRAAHDGRRYRVTVDATPATPTTWTGSGSAKRNQLVDRLASSGAVAALWLVSRKASRLPSASGAVRRRAVVVATIASDVRRPGTAARNAGAIARTAHCFVASASP